MVKQDGFNIHVCLTIGIYQGRLSILSGEVTQPFSVLPFSSTPVKSYRRSKQGPIVQSMVSLMSSLRGQLVKCFTTLLLNALIFFV